VREIVCHRQAFDAPGDGAWPSYRIAHKVHTPGMVDGQGRHQRYKHPYAFGLFTLSDWSYQSLVRQEHQTIGFE
jgi:hypothetical protein